MKQISKLLVAAVVLTLPGQVKAQDTIGEIISKTTTIGYDTCLFIGSMESASMQSYCCSIFDLCAPPQIDPIEPPTCEMVKSACDYVAEQEQALDQDQPILRRTLQAVSKRITKKLLGKKKQVKSKRVRHARKLAEARLTYDALGEAIDGFQKDACLTITICPLPIEIVDGGAHDDLPIGPPPAHELVDDGGILPKPTAEPVPVETPIPDEGGESIPVDPDTYPILLPVLPDPTDQSLPADGGMQIDLPAYEPEVILRRPR